MRTLTIVLLLFCAFVALAEEKAPPQKLTPLEIEKNQRLVTEAQLIQTQLQLLQERFVAKQSEIQAHQADILRARGSPEGTINWQTQEVIPKPKVEAKDAPAKK